MDRLEDRIDECRCIGREMSSQWWIGEMGEMGEQGRGEFPFSFVHGTVFNTARSYMLVLEAWNTRASCRIDTGSLNLILGREEVTVLLIVAGGAQARAELVL